ncbi:4Fe-4S binding protein [Aminipila terrae]|uniref:4Fe-4S dicluster domain-containing protein n=1 Tax=Aminipila terrae TaxID=2697030 RepID=A0A6P1MFB8_9FIRM|nr:4Fe-4S binding protein [Aminipila terrae]QHI71863.1 4Fe-4S dicluster domain-containing protein [Aminipila terrae]
MGVEPVTVIDKVAFIRCAGDAAGKERFAGYSSCDEARNKGFISGECKYGCIGLGSCIERCKFDAMSLEDGIVKIDKEKCNGCGACIGMCPQEIIVMIPKEATNFIPCASKNDEETTRKICGSGCIGCGDCEEVCPQNAITIVDNCAVIDYEKCVGCVACTVKCRKKIIVDELHDLTKVKENVAFVRCRGGKKANAKFKALGVETCADASKIRNEAMDLCQVGCVGLGACTKVCRFDAISIVDGTANVDPEKCVGCLDCVAACPNELIVEVPYVGSKLVACISTYDCDEKLRVCGEGCIGCGDCASNCPNGAITIKDLHAVIDTTLCENCSVCSYMCSRTALVEMVVPEANYLQRKALGI